MLNHFSRFAALFAISASLSLFGQGLTGTITGNVADQSGSPIPGAEITLNNVGTSQNRSTQSDSTGAFVFTRLLPSTYKVTVISKGFKRYQQTEIVLNCIDLQLGEISQTVEVTAETARL